MFPLKLRKLSGGFGVCVCVKYFSVYIHIQYIYIVVGDTDISVEISMIFLTF